MWKFKTSDTPLLQKALDYLVPYFIKVESWPYPEDAKINRYTASDLLCQGITQYPENRDIYADAYSSLVTNRSFIGIYNLMLCTT